MGLANIFNYTLLCDNAGLIPLDCIMMLFFYNFFTSGCKCLDMIIFSV